ncbi:DNA-methyltransferase [Limisalsivibrio acetivorans]|uniref:DNA-methyltransferase n=1 Tax=Limisalsivibrio acetivorans TaxID=1304888 RepID=UPI0003B37955|nr:site-specific DNA-methyltransferase [Limisalsivibrio acetivorans]
MKTYYSSALGELYNCDVLEGLRNLEDSSVDLIVTSPPYWGLRDYAVDGQLGLEEVFDCRVHTCGECFICRLVSVFSELQRVLKETGSLYLNIGDCYLQQQGKGFNGNKRLDEGSRNIKVKRPIPHKSTLGQPWRLAFALQDAGWLLRQEIIWHKPNPVPESVKDRCTKAHEQVFHFVKTPNYFYDTDAGKEPYTENTHQKTCAQDNRKYRGYPAGAPSRGGYGIPGSHDKMANKRSVWSIPPQRNIEGHFATFPEELVDYPVRVACPPGGTILDPFFGSGTVGVVSERHQRVWRGIELNPEYCSIAVRRLKSSNGTEFVVYKGEVYEQPSIEDFLKEPSF